MLLRKTACYIDLDQLDKNLSELQKVVGETKIMAVLKGDAYGHGAPEVFRHLLKKGIKYFAVAALNEALQLRRISKECEILILGWTPDELLHYVAENGITQAVWTYEQAKILSDLKRNAKVHIKVDTGMNRLGFTPTEESAETVKKITELPGLCVEGIFSHLSQLSVESDKKQAEKFDNFLKMCEKRGISFKLRHLVNGKNAALIPECRYDMVRSGTVLFGYYKNDDQMKVSDIMSLKTAVARVHKVPAGEGIGYDLLDPCDHDRIIATLPFGYADGVPKTLSNHKGFVSIRGKKAEICGNLCMDMCFADVTDIEGVKAGDEVTVYGEGAMSFIDARALSGVGITNLQVILVKRVPRVYIENGKAVKTVDALLGEEE